MNTKPTLDELFERRIIYPDFEPQARLARLVGLDEYCRRNSVHLRRRNSRRGWQREHSRND